ncbi:MAG: hypothetical protein K2X81_00465, partial [Candidatus Obscuribacterales bacterium]|nr:hypothetical protein [Candidatus Obscuribacterales bacterium]
SMDNFSAWTIYASIIGLQVDPHLWFRLGAGDDCLLFRQADYLDPKNSCAFAAFEKHTDLRLQALGRFLRQSLNDQPMKIQYLQNEAPLVDELPQLDLSVNSMRTGPRVISSSLPDWVLDHASDELIMTGTNTRPTINHVPAAPIDWIDPGSLTHENNINQNAARKVASNNSFLEHELLEQPKRKKRKKNSTHWGSAPTPLKFFLLMLVNPILWLSAFLVFQTLGPDADLAQNGRDYYASITNINEMRGRGRPQVRFDFSYQVDNAEYTGAYFGDPSILSAVPLKIHALPNNPTFRESLNAQPGSKRLIDGLYSILSFLVLLPSNFVVMRFVKQIFEDEP